MRGQAYTHTLIRLTNDPPGDYQDYQVTISETGNVVLNLMPEIGHRVMFSAPDHGTLSLFLSALAVGVDEHWEQTLDEAAMASREGNHPQGSEPIDGTDHEAHDAPRGVGVSDDLLDTAERRQGGQR